MSALARYFFHSGIKVSGYDRDKTALTKKLEELGIGILYEFEPKRIENPVDLVIYTPAIKKDQPEFDYFVQAKIPMMKRSEALMAELDRKQVIAVAGTHGKTSTAGLLAHILHQNDFGATAFVGGIMVDYQSNFLFGKGPWVIVEADEYDRSFWRLFPDIAIIQAMDADHLDIYGTEEEMVDAYRVFAHQIKKGGQLFIESETCNRRIDKKWLNGLEARKINVSTFGLQHGNMRLEYLKEEEGTSYFKIRDKALEFELNVPGAHNVQNALAAIAVAGILGLDDEQIALALKNFNGIYRRFEYVVKTNEHIIIDDYAHHPQEIRAAIKAARGHHKGRKLTVVFQPHLYTRTRDFMEDFGKELSTADEVILVELYPAREKPINGINSGALLKRVTNEQKMFVPKAELIEYLKQTYRPLILLLGAGDVYKLNEQIKSVFS